MKQTRVIRIELKNMKGKRCEFSNQLNSHSTHLLIFLLMNLSLFAQVPQKMSYQAIIRNSSKALITSTQVGMQISILQGSSTGIAVYVETQTPSTNINGLVSVEIGSGTIVTGTFTGIYWATGPYFIKIETDPTGGTDYTITGTSELKSVPYALHTETAMTAIKLAAPKNINGVPFDGSTDITITSTQMQYFEKELVYDGENSVTLTFSLAASSRIYYNGTLLRRNQWSGVGLATLTLIFDTRQNDQLTVAN
jgi:hypothetical protein